MLKGPMEGMEHQLDATISSLTALGVQYTLPFNEES